MVAETRTVIAVTGDDSSFEAVRSAAIERALADRAVLILYDVDAVQSPLESPLPTGWSAEGTEEDVGDRLGPEELEAAGREPTSRQVRAAREQGVDAWGWLPADSGREALIEYAARQPGARILVPDGYEDFDVGELPAAEAVPVSER